LAPLGGERDLTVAVTGPTGTFGFGLIPLLQADDRVTRIVGIARRLFDPATYGWTKMEYRPGEVRDPSALRDAAPVRLRLLGGGVRGPRFTALKALRDTMRQRGRPDPARR
jgi:hypothetical protein